MLLASIIIIIIIIIFLFGPELPSYRLAASHSPTTSASTVPDLALESPVFYRPVFARIYSWTLVGETPASVGTTVASLRPSYVLGLIRLEASDSVLVPPTCTPALGQNMTQILNYGVPLMLHINNGAVPVDSSSNTFHSDWNFFEFTDTTRGQFIAWMAQNEKANGFAFIYPLFWPDGTIASTPTYWD